MIGCKRKGFFSGAIVVAIGMAAALAQAAEPSPSKEQVTERTEGVLALWDALRANAANVEADFEEALVSSGEFDGARALWIRSGLTLRAGTPISDRVSLGISPSFAYEHVWFDGSDQFRSSQSGGRSTRLDDFLDSALRIGGKLRLNNGFGLELVSTASLRQEMGADFGESLRVGGSFAGTYRRGQWLRLRLGLGLGTDLGDKKLRLSPVYRIQVRPRPDLSLEVSGLRGSIEWDALPRLQLGLSGGLDSTQYRLDRRGRPPKGLGSGVLQRRQTAVHALTVYRITEWLRLRFALGLVFVQELTVLDDDGDEIDQRTDRDPSMTAAVRFEFRR